MFEVNIAVHIHKWEHVMVFGEDEPLTPRIAVWKSDVETHFEPLVPVHFADVPKLTLRQLTLHPLWKLVHSSAFPPSPPRTPSPAATSSILVSDGEEVTFTSPSDTRRMSKRLSSRMTRVYTDADGEEHTASDEHVSGSESEFRPPVPFPIQSSCVHKASGRARKIVKCEQSVAVDSDHPVPVPNQSSCVHKASGRARTTIKSVPSACDDDSPLVPPIPHGLALGTTFSAPEYVKGISPEAKDWLMQEFTSAHPGGQIKCVNSRLDYIYARCFSCDARAAVTLKQPFTDKKWDVTTVKNGADAACRSSLPPLPPPQLPCPLSPPQAEMECLVCGDKVTSYSSCVSGHVLCWPCMDGAIASQCTSQDFVRNRGIVCPCCPMLRPSLLPFERIKHRLSTASVQHVAKAERDLIADDAYKAFIVANPKKDHVDSTLEWLLDPERCPNCNTAYEVCTVVPICVHKRCVYFVYTTTHMVMQHDVGCTAMLCARCKTTFCLYCRTTFVDTKELKASDACHNHIWTCGKIPPLRSFLCTESVLFPANEGDDDFIRCFMNCRKLDLLQQTVCGNWSALEIKRLILHVDFQGFLKHLKERQTHYRAKYPNKQDILRMCFVKTLGATQDFKFDVSSHAPSWSNDYTEEEEQEFELRRKLRSEAKLQEQKEADAKAVLENAKRVAKRADAITALESMGFDYRKACVALEASQGDVDAAIAMLVD